MKVSYSGGNSETRMFLTCWEKITSRNVSESGITAGIIAKIEKGDWFEGDDGH